MEKKKLLLYYNTAPHYRTAIFKMIDEAYDCDWYFGETKTDIKEMDKSLLKNVTMYRSFGNPTKLYWTCSLIPLLFKRKYQTFFILAESRSVSCWTFLFLAHLFFPKKKIYDWGHGWYGKETKLQATIKKWMFHRLTGTFVYGDYAKRLMIEQGIDGNKLFVIKNSLDYDKQLAIRKKLKETDLYKKHFGNDFPVAVFIGRLTSRKRLDMLLEVCTALKDRKHDINVVLVGNGDHKDYLMQYTKEHSLSDRVWFYGACYDEEQNAELLYNATICVSPGDVGLTAMHCMVFGTPVITHNAFMFHGPEFESVKPGVTGDFYEYGSVVSLADTTQRWLESHQDKREAVRQACYKEIDSYWNPHYQMAVIKENLKFQP